jgi:histidyl-tRNA synthetase
MTGTIPPRLPRGMRDILPQQMLRRNYVVGVIEETFQRFGFEPLQTPALELADTLTGKYGEEAEQLIYYAKHTRGKEALALRYDLTVPLSRVVAMHENELSFPFKRYHIAPVWRAERPQKGRYREFYQCDVDIVGVASVLADAEIIAVIIAALERLGFRGFRTALNNRKILTGIGQYAGVPDEQLPDLYRAIDKLDKIGEEGVREELRESGIADAVIARMMALLRLREGDNLTRLANLSGLLADYPAAMEGIRELEDLVAYLGEMGVGAENIDVDFAMVRGLSYYTGPIYETFVEEPKIGSITGGGRYDALIGLFRRESLPVTGTSLGIERIIDVMDELGMFPEGLGETVSQALVTAFDAATLPASLRMASALRREGLNTELFFDVGKPVGDQIRYALKRGTGYVVILGPDEVAGGTATVRSLATREQETVPQGEVGALIRRWMMGAE